MVTGKRPQVAILGGGFAGVATVLRLLANTQGPLALTVIEPAATLGLGQAYATTCAEHRVNGLASAFGIVPEDPLHWVNWLARQGWSPEPGVALADSFPPRQCFGQYVGEVLAEALQAHAGRLQFTHHRARAIAVQPGVVQTTAGSVTADTIVIATGLYPSAPVVPVPDALLASGRVLREIPAPEALTQAAVAAEVFVVGTSLSALDTILSFEAAGFRGRYTAVSRRGLWVPPRHAVEPWPDFLAGQPLPRTVRALLRRVREQRHAIRRQGDDWQRLTPALRPYIAELWREAPLAEQRRFAARVRPYWDVSLHRAAPPSAAQVEALRAAGRLRVLRGRVQGLAAAPQAGEHDRITVHWQAAGGAAQTQQADYVALAQGHDFDWHRIDDPLVRDLVAQGYVVPHPNGFGVEAQGSSGQIKSRAGELQPWLYAVGHPLRGVNWESNAIQEQLTGAQAMASHWAAQWQQAPADLAVLPERASAPITAVTPTPVKVPQPSAAAGVGATPVVVSTTAASPTASPPPTPAPHRASVSLSSLQPL